MVGAMRATTGQQVVCDEIKLLAVASLYIQPAFQLLHNLLSDWSSLFRYGL